MTTHADTAYSGELEMCASYIASLTSALHQGGMAELMRDGLTLVRDRYGIRLSQALRGESDLVNPWDIRPIWNPSRDEGEPAHSWVDCSTGLSLTPPLSAAITT